MIGIATHNRHMTTKIKNDLSKFDAYRKQWPFGLLIKKERHENLTSDDVRKRVMQKAAGDAKLQKEVFENPRYVWAIALEEGVGIRAKDFLRTVKTVAIHPETDTELYLKLPACHGGCRAPGVHSAPDCHSGNSCHVCGLSFKAPIPDAQTDTSQRSYIDAVTCARAVADSMFRHNLLHAPFETYTQFARQLASGASPAYLQGIQKIVVIEEQPDEIHIVVPRC
jgi:hypothetical protein